MCLAATNNDNFFSYSLQLLQKESKKLHGDVEDLENALILHQRFQEVDENSVRGILRLINNLANSINDQHNYFKKSLISKYMFDMFKICHYIYKDIEIELRSSNRRTYWNYENGVMIELGTKFH